jgi:hypothetical protein
MNRTLFIFSDDFGELVLLRLLLYKQPVHAFLLLPERLFKHVEFPNATKFLYKDGNDLKKHVEEINPEQVMLFSAYLLAPNGLISYPEFYSLLDYLDEKNITVATSDPFMRYYDQLAYEHPPESFHAAVRNKLKEISGRVALYRHLYAVPVQFDGAPSQSFSNHLMCDVKEQTNKRKQWTFIMASEDFRLLQKENPAGYHKKLIPLFISLVKDYNIRVNLVFPEAFYRTLKLGLAGVPGINYVSYCSLASFESLVAQSDLVIYWNMFSASTLLCRLYNKPTVFLGLGHMETLFPGFFEYIKSSWFPYEAPEIMNVNDALIPSLIKRLEADGAAIRDHALYQPYYELDSPLAVFSCKTEVI